MERATALVLRVSGEVKESNVSDFVKDARIFIDGINTKLVTDQDFGEAKDNVKECKEKETQIANAKQKAIMSMAEISKTFIIVDKVYDEYRDTRLVLDKLVKTEEDKRKSEIVNAGIAKVAARLTGSWVNHYFSIDSAGIKDAVKGKRSIAKMEEAVAKEVDTQLLSIQYSEQNFAENVISIEESEQHFPGLYPDWKDVALYPGEHVLTTIQAREEKFKNDKREAEERAAAKKAEEERIAKEKAAKAEADRIAKEKRILAEKAEQESAQKTEQVEIAQEKPKAEPAEKPAVFTPPPSTEFTPPPIADNPFVDADISPPKPKTVTLSVEVEASLATEISDLILTMDGVLCVRG